MKFLKGLLTCLIGLLLIVLINLFALSIIFKNLVQRQMVGAVIQEEMVNDIIEDSDVEHKEEIKELLSDEELYDIVSDVMDDYLEAIDNENYEVSDKTIDRIINYVEKHKTEIEKISGEEIDMNEIRSEKLNLSKDMNEGLTDFKVDDNAKIVLKAYRVFVSNTFRIIILVIILVLVGILILINKNVFGFLKTTGISFIISGISMSLFYVLVKLALQEMVKDASVEITIDPSSMLVAGVIEMVIGAVLVIANKVIANKNTKKETIQEQA